MVDTDPVRANEDTPDRTDVVRRRLKGVEVGPCASDNEDDVLVRAMLNEAGGGAAGVAEWEGKEGKGVDLTTYGQ